MMSASRFANRRRLRRLSRVSGVLMLAFPVLACSAGGPLGGSGVVDGSGQTASRSTPLDPDAPSAAGDYLAGRFALDQGDVRTAAESFERALSVAPDNVELRRQVFLLKLASGDIDSALGDAEDLAAVDPDADEVDLLFALRDVKQGRYPDARRWLEQLSSHGVTGLAAPLLLAWTDYGDGKLDAAMRRLRPASPEDGLGPLRRYHQALMLGILGRDEEAALLLQGEIKPGMPASPRLVQALAALWARQGQTGKAVELLRSQSALVGNEGVLPELLADAERGKPPPLPASDAASGIADALLGLAEALNQQRAGTQALLFARLAAYLAPERGDVWVLIGLIEQGQDNSAEAIRAFEAVPTDSPYSWEARLAEASALDAAGRERDAVATLEQMVQDRPQRTDALRALGDLHRADERYAEAEAAYGQAVARLNQPEPEDWRLYYAHGITLERLKRWPEAEAQLLRGLELSPDQPLVLNYLGYSWVDQGLNLDRAKAMLHRAVELRPQDGFIADSLGWAYYRLGEYEAAVTQLERAVELEPGDPVINDHLGDAYWQVNRQREARFQWERSLTLEPADEAVAEIENKLRRGLPATTSARRG
jgi:tetratricopeptide (TPR) repeat protein